MRCGHSRRLLEERTAGGLDERRAAELAAHLDACGRCRRLADELAGVDRLLAALPAPRDDDAFFARLAERIDAGLEPRRPPLVVPRWRRAAAVAGAAACLAFGLFAVRQLPEPAPTSSSAVDYAAAPSPAPPEAVVEPPATPPTPTAPATPPRPEAARPAPSAPAPARVARRAVRQATPRRARPRKVTSRPAAAARAITSDESRSPAPIAPAITAAAGSSDRFEPSLDSFILTAPELRSEPRKSYAQNLPNEPTDSASESLASPTLAVVADVLETEWTETPEPAL